MSNIKLYTEEQVRSLLDKMSLITERKKLGVSANFRSRKIEIDDLIKSIDFIELPSDEEIRKQSLELSLTPASFQLGAKWVIEQIKQKVDGK